MAFARQASILVLVLGLTATIEAQRATDWTQWRGPNRDGTIAGFTAPSAWPERLNRRWSIDVGLGYAISSNQLKYFLPDLLATKVAQHGTLDANAQTRHHVVEHVVVLIAELIDENLNWDVPIAQVVRGACQHHCVRRARNAH